MNSQRVEDEADLSAYPIIRLDQLHLFETSRIQQLNIDAQNLLQDLLDDHYRKNSFDTSVERPRLCQYLERQIHHVQIEVTRRAAEERIDTLLQSVHTDRSMENTMSTECLHLSSVRSSVSAPSSSLSPRPSNKTNSVDNANIKLGNEKVNDMGNSSYTVDDSQDSVEGRIVKVFRPLPLPSELLLRENKAISKSDKEKDNYNDHVILTHSQSSLRPSTIPLVSQTTILSSSTPSSSSQHHQNQNIFKDSYSADESDTSSSMSDCGYKPSTSRQSRHVRIKEISREIISKKGVEEMYKNFGTIFMVAPTDKKIRFFPKKQAVESFDDAKERERNERRKLAVKRLTERRERRQEELLRKRLLRASMAAKEKTIDSRDGKVSLQRIDEEKSLLLNQTPIQEMNNSNNSSDSESVSGGDDMDEVDIDPTMVAILEKNLNQTTKSETKEIPVSSSNKNVSVSGLRRDFNFNDSFTMGKGKEVKREADINTNTNVKSSSYDYSKFVTTRRTISKPNVERQIQINEAIDRDNDNGVSLVEEASKSVESNVSQLTEISIYNSEQASDKKQYALRIKSVSSQSETSDRAEEIMTQSVGISTNKIYEPSIDFKASEASNIAENVSRETPNTLSTQTPFRQQDDNQPEYVGPTRTLDSPTFCHLAENITNDHMLPIDSSVIVAEFNVSDSISSRPKSIQHESLSMDGNKNQLLLNQNLRFISEFSSVEPKHLDPMESKLSTLKSQSEPMMALTSSFALEINQQDFAQLQSVGINSLEVGAIPLNDRSNSSRNISNSSSNVVDIENFHSLLTKNDSKQQLSENVVELNSNSVVVKELVTEEQKFSQELTSNLVRRNDNILGVGVNRKLEESINIFSWNKEMNRFESNYKMTELPGLLAWHCDEDTNSFSIDLHEYKSCDKKKGSSTKVIYPSSAEDNSLKIIPYRLVAFVQTSAKLLLGLVDVDSEEEFMNNWKDVIDFFYQQTFVNKQVQVHAHLMAQIDMEGWRVCNYLSNVIQFKYSDNIPWLISAVNVTLSSVDKNPKQPFFNDYIDVNRQLVDDQMASDSRPSSPVLLQSVDRDIAESDQVQPKFRIKSTESASWNPTEDKSVQDKKDSSTNLIPISKTLIPAKPRLLSDIYSHIGMIFPASYGFVGNIRAADTISARALLESMQIQSKLYDEWMEIMGDYATVFSEDRGFNSVNETNNSSAIVYGGSSNSLHYRVKSIRPEVGNIITDVLNELEMNSMRWHELPPGLGLGISWNLLWTWQKPHINMSHLLIWQRVNHFLDSKHLTRKDLLKKSLQRFTDFNNKIAEAFEIMPETYLLPHEYTQFIKAFTSTEAQIREYHSDTTSSSSRHTMNYWIMKPVGLSRGRGISLIRDIASVTYSTSSVIQKYIERPLCLQGYKFDLRLYVLVTSFQPLEAFIYREGFARISTHAYSTSIGDIDNKFIHLTNSSIQKHNMDPISVDNPLIERHEEVGGSKIALLGPHGLWTRLKNSHQIDCDDLWNRICLVVLKSLVAVDEKISYQPCCFEVFGYDIIIDQDLRPWLLEVNSSPSLARENSLDYRVKNAMIRDTIQLLNPAPYDRGAVSKILKRRLNDITKNKVVTSRTDEQLESDLRSILGSYYPRQYGEIPKYMGDYEKLSPDTKMFQYVTKLRNKLIKPMI